MVRRHEQFACDERCLLSPVVQPVELRRVGSAPGRGLKEGESVTGHICAQAAARILVVYKSFFSQRPLSRSSSESVASMVLC